MFADKVVVDDIDTIKTLLALLEMAKNISSTHRKFWRSKDESTAVDANPQTLEYLDIDASDFLELRDEIMHKLRNNKSL